MTISHYLYVDEGGNAEHRDVDTVVSRDTDTTSGGRHSCPRGVKLRRRRQRLYVCLPLCDKVCINTTVIAELESVAIANALQLEEARRRAVPLRFNFVARVKFELALPIPYRLSAFLLLIRYVTL